MRGNSLTGRRNSVQVWGNDRMSARIWMVGAQVRNNWTQSEGQAWRPQHHAKTGRDEECEIGPEAQHSKTAK